jgi:hypothetical protein
MVRCMSRNIDRKYAVSGQMIIKVSDGSVIPEDEPLILFRARDKLAVTMMEHYLSLCRDAGCDPGQLELMHRRIADFLAWQKENEAVMKRPSSEPGDDYS